MSGKPRKAFDGIARPQGFIDDAAKAVLKTVSKVENKIYRKAEKVVLNRAVRKQIPRKMVPAKDDRMFYRAERRRDIMNEGGPFLNKPPKPKELPSIKGKSPRPKPSKPNPRAQTTAEMDESLRVDARLRAAIKPKTKPERRMSPYYKTSKNSRNYRG
jgi:hypothetical protein